MPIGADKKTESEKPDYKPEGQKKQSNEKKSAKLKCFANSLSKKRLEKLLRMFCTHRETDKCQVNCADCILINIPWDLKGKEITLCRAIHREGILNG